MQEAISSTPRTTQKKNNSYTLHCKTKSREPQESMTLHNITTQFSGKEIKMTLRMNDFKCNDSEALKCCLKLLQAGCTMRQRQGCGCAMGQIFVLVSPRFLLHRLLPSSCRLLKGVVEPHLPAGWC